jgi:hypothetical protein
MAGFNSMEVVDAVSKQLITTVSTGTYSHSIAVNPINNEEFVPISGMGIAVYQRVTVSRPVWLTPTESVRNCLCRLI